MFDPKSDKNLSERELRSLSTDDFLALLQQDIKDLDRAWKERRRAAGPGQPQQPAAPTAPAAKPRRGRTPPEPPARPAGDSLAHLLEEARSEMPPEDLDKFHSVTCCDVHLGDFPPIARVCCPFCGTWHRAGDHPRTT